MHKVCLFLLEYNACDLWQCLIKIRSLLMEGCAKPSVSIIAKPIFTFFFMADAWFRSEYCFSGLALTQVACTSNLFWNKPARTAVGMKFECKQASGSVKRSHLYHVSLSVWHSVSAKLNASAIRRPKLKCAGCFILVLWHFEGIFEMTRTWAGEVMPEIV